MQIITEKHAVGSPDLVVEIGSPGTRRRDETIKLHVYETYGVAEYWIADPVREAVRVYRRAGETFASAVELRAQSGETLTTPLLPGLEIPLSRVFAA
jgi:Uma2 family endonuclease